MTLFNLNYLYLKKSRHSESKKKIVSKVVKHHCWKRQLKNKNIQGSIAYDADELRIKLKNMGPAKK